MSFINLLGQWLSKIHQSFADATINANNIILTRHNGNTVTLTVSVPSYAIATQTDNGLMSATDKSKLDNLPAWSLANSAGRASGSMIYNGYLAMRGIDDTSTLTLAAAEDGNSSKGAKFYLYGTATESHQGEFILQAGSVGGTYKQLVGNADGTLKWDGVSISMDGHTHPYLPLTGGTVSGTIVFSGAIDMRSDTADKQLILLGGNGANASLGANLVLSGADYTNSGWFTLQAGNSTGYKQLIGKPDGTLTWGGHQFAPLPQASNIGTWQRILASSSYSLPSGGTWAYVLEARNSSGGFWGLWAGTAAGGTLVANNSAIARLIGFCWRIA